MNSKTKGILCIVTAAFCFAFMSLCVRLAGDLPSMQKILFRNLLAFFIVGAGLVRKPEKLEIHKGDLKFLFLRSICGTVGIVCNFYAIDHLVLSDANMLNKLSPFFTIIFSYFLLKERLTLFQGIAVVVAFMGALFIIKPTGNMTDPAALIGMLGGAGAGAAYGFVRVLGKRGVNGKLIVMFFSAFTCVFALPFLIGHFAPMKWWQVAAMIAAGFGGAGGQIFVTKAYFYAPAKEISVFDYSQIMFSALMGFLVLGQKPDMLSLCGYVIICTTAVCMYFYNKNRRTL